ncbi:hypothetical protein HZA73_07160 [candidate division TA06 bacterium]|nr:hypothetical protein [candidate division TA06 bacterium]
MSLLIRINNDALLTLEQLSEVKDCPQTMGLSTKEYRELEKALLKGDKVPVIPTSLTGIRENHEIVSNGTIVGRIILIYDIDDKHWEIDIIINRNFRKKGFAKHAIMLLLKNYPERKWRGIIKDYNPNRETIKHILQINGFAEVEHMHFIKD